MGARERGSSAGILASAASSAGMAAGSPYISRHSAASCGSFSSRRVKASRTRRSRTRSAARTNGTSPASLPSSSPSNSSRGSTAGFAQLHHALHQIVGNIARIVAHNPHEERQRGGRVQARETDRSATDPDPSDRLSDFARQSAQYREASSRGNRESRAAAAGPPECIHVRRLPAVDRPKRLRSVPAPESNQDVANQCKQELLFFFGDGNRDFGGYFAMQTDGNLELTQRFDRLLQRDLAALDGIALLLRELRRYPSRSPIRRAGRSHRPSGEW